MFRIFKKIWKYLTTRLHIVISPPPDSKIRSFKIYRMFPLLILIVIIGTIGILGFLYRSYEKEYIVASKKLAELKRVKKENQRLKDEIYALTQDTKNLKESLRKLEKSNKKIRGMINISKKNKNDSSDNFEFQLTTMISYNKHILKQEVPLGGGSLHLYYQEPQELINRMKNNLNVIKEELPEQKNRLNNLENSVRKYNEKKAATPLIWPVADKGKGYISSDFGWRVDPVSGKQEYHEGLDIGVWYNTPVLATADGIITYVGWSGGYGRVIKIKHGFGYITRYAHLNKIKVKKGQEVKRGEVIGLTGNSGRSTGPHLHYEVKLNNIPQNPRKYIGGVK